MNTPAQTQAINRYHKKHMKRYAFQLHKERDKDILDFLALLPNVNGYLKELVRSDMAKREKLDHPEK